MKKNDSRKLGATTSLGSQTVRWALGRDIGAARLSGGAVGVGWDATTPLQSDPATALQPFRPCPGRRSFRGDRDPCGAWCKKRHARIAARGECPFEMKLRG